MPESSRSRYNFFPFQSLLAKQPATPTRGATVSVSTSLKYSYGLIYSLFFELYDLDRQTKLFACGHSLVLVSVLQESPGRPASGSPRPAGRAGQPTVTSGSPMAAVKKPDPNMKGGSSMGAHLHSYVVIENHTLHSSATECKVWHSLF